MFITIPKVFDSMGLGTAVGILFFVLVLFAAMTSSIALTESAVSTFQDELGWSRKKSTVLMGAVMITLGSLSSLGYGPLANVTLLGMQFLDFFDFLTNSVMMPIAAHFDLPAGFPRRRDRGHRAGGLPRRGAFPPQARIHADDPLSLPAVRGDHPHQLSRQRLRPHQHVILILVKMA